ncbi:MAG TPA: peptidase S10, partial [Porphyromonadaceae bacterium]|nr:peptidase S10 [Porphyromonadaceae bacterium]
MKYFKSLWMAGALALAAQGAYADEGMYLLNELNKKNLEQMKALGFTLPYDSLYSTTSPSVSDAVVIFGGGCTGIAVSDQGLIFTNHHCGYGAIQSKSSVEHDYLKDGFVSQSMEQEIPIEGLEVRFLKNT